MFPNEDTFDHWLETRNTRTFVLTDEEPKPCKVFYRDNGEKKDVVGTLELSKEETVSFKKIVVRTDDGDVQLMVGDIDKIIEDTPHTIWL